MPSLPLELHQVLEEEYVSMYGPLARPAVTYDEKQILDAARACTVLRDCGIAAERDAASIARTLSELVETDAAPSRLIASPDLTRRGRLLLDQYDALRALAEESDAPDGGRELRRTIVDDALGTAVRHLSDIRLDGIYRAIHARHGFAAIRPEWRAWSTTSSASTPVWQSGRRTRRPRRPFHLPRLRLPRFRGSCPTRS